MTPALMLDGPCPKCGYHDGRQTWKGPRYVREPERLQYICESCGYVLYLPCCDAEPQG